MKKIYLLIIGILFLVPSIALGNEIKNIDMSIYIDNSGTGHVLEKWDVHADGNTEFYKQYKNMDKSVISNYKVSMNNKDFELTKWNINSSFNDKAYKYGYNYISDGVELCFGISEYGNNSYTISYDISNFIYNTSDNYQIAYWNLIQPSSDKINNVNIKIYSDFKYADTLDVWGYGKYGAPCYVYDGVIEMTSEGKLSSNEYMTILVKFPNDTFNINNNTSKTFDEYLDMANNGTKKYNKSIFKTIFDGIFGFLSGFIVPILIVISAIITKKKSGYGYKDNKVIDKNNTPFFRDIPCNKNIYLADTLVHLNKNLYSNYKETNIFGAIILKWLKQDKIRIINTTKGIFNKETSSIDLTLNPIFDDYIEKELFDLMYEASKDGILEANELERWCKTNYTKFFGLFTRINNIEIDKLKSENHIYNRVNKEECKKKKVMDDYIYDESKKLYGSKLFLDEFSKIDTREAIEVKLWDEYLMFAYIFGTADKVAKQFKNLYPEVLNNPNNSYGYDYATLMYINHISTSSVNAASTARARAQSYSSGGGGFSSGGGGGGSFGGGGSMGSR